jgi:serine/threonine protein kinase
MPAPESTEDFLDVVRKSRQIDNARLEAYLCERRGDPLPAEPRQLAALLVRSGVMTTFQAEQFLQGKYKGFLLGGYRILERLGIGGTGVVYLAEHQVMRRRVALKVLPAAGAAEAGILERFRREAQAAAALNHPNIVRAYDFREEGPMPFLVMEHVDGPSLQEVIERQGALPVAVACEYIRQTAIGLQHAHEAGLVHRDIKPANLLVDAAGTVKVLDLGLSRFCPEGTESVTKKFDEHMVMGTVDYLAPEQALSLHNVDARADIYSLGATLYTLLTGEPPFHKGTLTQKLLWHQMLSPPPIRDRRADVPPEVARIVSSMMAKAREDRIQTAGEVADRLQPWSVATPTPQVFAPPGLPAEAETSPNLEAGSSRAITAERTGEPGTALSEPAKDSDCEEQPYSFRDELWQVCLAVLLAILCGTVLGTITFFLFGPQPTVPLD